MSWANTAVFSTCRVTPAGRALVWASILEMKMAIWARLTGRSGPKVVAVTPWVTPSS